MDVSFASAQEVAQRFRDLAILDVAIMLAMAVIVLLALRGRLRPSTKKTIGGLCLAGTIGLVGFAYASTFGQFVGARVDTSGVRLIYAGPLGGEIPLPRDSIEAVLSGMQGTVEDRSCYISFRGKAGENYRSATLAGAEQACVRLQGQIAAALAL